MPPPTPTDYALFRLVGLSLILFGLGIFACFQLWRLHRQWLHSANSWNTFDELHVLDQPWRKQTDVRFIEELKRELELMEPRWAEESREIFEFRSLHKSFFKNVLERLEWNDGIRRRLQSAPVRFVKICFIIMSKTPPQPFHPEAQKNYRTMLARLDRIVQGNARLEIGDLEVKLQKLTLRSDIDSEAQKIDVARDLNDLKELTKHSEIPSSYRGKFEDKKTKRGLDTLFEIFEAFERPFEKEIELRERYNKFKEDIQNRSTMSEEQKLDLLRELDRRLSGLVSKDKENAKAKFDVYGKEA